MKLPKSIKYYAVKVGQKPGVYETWKECQQHVTGFKGSQYKSFNNRADAWAYIKGAMPNSFETKSKPAKSEKRASRLSNFNQAYNAYVSEKALIVFTDGASRNNNLKDASTRRAGIGVFFGFNDPRNISEPFLMDPVTNQRAELFAVIRALEALERDYRDSIEKGNQSLYQRVVVITDSQYTISCMTSWLKTWKQNNWMSSTGEPVKNRELIERLDEAIHMLPSVEFLHVPGHSDVPGNVEADKLATSAADSV
jgi:ribonuclease HI